jgi:ArsR family transcriptional regulator
MRTPLDPDTRLLQAAADPTRMAILRILTDLGETCACDLAQPGISQPTLSHHLRVLREAGWVNGERRGTWIWYTIRPEAVTRFEHLAMRLGGRTGPPGRTRRLPVMTRPDA